MSPPRKTALWVAFALSFLWTAASAAPSPRSRKIDARVHSSRADKDGSRGKIFLRVMPGTTIAALRAAHPGVKFGSQSGGVVSARASDAAIDALADDARVQSIEASLRARPTVDVVRSSTTSGGLALGAVFGTAATDLLSATGAGVVIGVVDSGIDYMHGDFITPGNASRILSIWDQTILSHPATGGPLPAGYSYGAEYSNTVLTAKIGGSGTVNTYDTDGHGTHVASIAAGDGSFTGGGLPAGTFQGVAPLADLIIVKTTFDTPDIVDAVNYIVAKAAAAGKRVVINLSLGLQLGPHDGTSTFESAIGAIAATTPIVVAMGNDQTAKPHAGIDVGFGGSAGVVVSVDAAIFFADIEFWHPSGDAYTVSVVLSGVSGSLTLPANSSGTVTLSGHVIKLYNGFNTGHPSGDKQVFVSVDRGAGFTASAINVTFSRDLNGGTGRIDGWVDPGLQGVSFASFIDNTRTLGEPACAQNVFGVGAFASKKFWNSIDLNTYNYTTQSALGNLSHFSSIGPTRDGRQQPEVTAPGDVIMGAMSANTAPAVIDDYIAVDNRHRVLRGTSMAAPVVTGIIAARLQAGPTRTPAQLRAILRAQARADGATGTLPNYSYGYGKASASPQPVSPPTGLTATTMGASSVTWSWSAVVGADSYRLYYSTNSSVLLASVAAPPYIHTGLAANTTTGVLIKGVGGNVDGPGAFISTSTLAPAPAALPTVTPHVDSATVSWTPCPAAPAAVSCFGYDVAATTAANGSGTKFTAQTTNRALASLAITGLQPLTTYYFRQSTLNFYGAPTATGPVSATTLTDLVPPSNPQFSGATASEIRFDWNNAGNPPGVVFVADASTAPAFTGTMLSSATKNTFAVIGGLSTNTSYYFRVQATGGPYLVPGIAVPTLAAAPVASTSPYSAVGASGFTVGWSTGSNPPNTLYQAEISASAAFSPLAGSSSTRNAFASFAGLTSNTLYYARALAISQGGIATAYTTFGSTPTIVLAPTLPAQPFSNQAADGFTFSFIGGNLAGTAYLVRISTDPGFGLVAGSVNTTATSASFAGLSSNRRYYAVVAALNVSGTPTAFTGAVSTGTMVTAPTTPSVPLTGRSTGTLAASWGSSTLGPGTIYTFQASPLANFAGAVSSNTANPYATIGSLAPNTIQYLRVRAVSLNPPTPDSAWTALGTGSTLANAPAAAGAPFPLVGVASMTVAWTPLPLAPQASACQGYVAEASAFSDFSTILRSSAVAPGAASANLSGLSFATTYYFRVASLDQEGNPNYLVIGATRTSTPLLSSATMTTGALNLTLPASFSELPAVSVFFEAGTFPPGTVVTMLSGVTVDLTNPRSSVASLTALGASVGIDISAGGLQPLKPVRLTMTYDPAFLSPAQDARRLLVARYDEPSGLWVMVPSAVDTSAKVIVATLDHFSSYAPFFAAAGAALSDGVVFPQPWEAGEPNGSYGSQALTFANYPAGTKARLMSLAGELIWEGTAAANGVLTWDGRNKSGRSVASGTYYAILESGGARKVRRVVVIR